MKNKITTIRINEKLKQNVIPILEELGINFSQLIDLLMRQIVQYKCLPWKPSLKVE